MNEIISGEKSEYYDEREFIRKEVNPLLAEAVCKCKQRNIPLLFVVGSNSNEKTVVISVRNGLKNATIEMGGCESLFVSAREED